MADMDRGSEVAWWAYLLWGISAMILGAFLLASPAKTLVALIVFLGFYWIIRGVLSVAEALTGETANRGLRLFAGIISVLAGAFVVAYPYASALVVPFVYVVIIGVLAVVYGFLYIYHGVRGGGGGAIVLGVLDVIFGAIVLASPYVATLAVPYVLGIFGIIDGLVLIGLSFMMRSHQHTTAHMAPA